MRPVELPPVSGRERQGQFIRLAGVADIEKPEEAHIRPGKPFFFQIPRGSGQERPEEPGEFGRSDLSGSPKNGTRIILDRVGEQHPEGRQHPGVFGHDDSGDAKSLGQAAGVHTARPAERKEGEIARVEAPFDRDDPDRPLHRRIGDADDPFSKIEDVHLQARGEFLHHPPRPLGVQLHLSAEKAPGVEPAEQQVGVRHSDVFALPVTDRARVGAGALRPHAEGSTLVDKSDRPASRSDGVDIDDGQAQRQVADRRFGGGGDFPVAKGHIRRSPAHIEGDDLPETGGRGDLLSAHHAPGRTAEDGADGVFPGALGGDTAPVRLHDPDPARAETFLQAPEIALHERGDVSIDGRRAGALELPVLPQD